MKKILNKKPVFVKSILADGTVVHIQHNPVFDGPFPYFEAKSNTEGIKTKLKNMRISKEFEELIEIAENSFKSILNGK